MDMTDKESLSDWGWHLDIRQFRGDELDITDYELPDLKFYSLEVASWT